MWPNSAIPPASSAPRADKNLGKMALEGELDAAIYGAELPVDKRLQSVIPDPEAAAWQWHAKHGVVPINHMVVVTQTLARSRPEAVAGGISDAAASKQAAGLPSPAASICIRSALPPAGRRRG